METLLMNVARRDVARRTPLRRAEILAGGAVKMSALDQNLPEERRKERERYRESELPAAGKTNKQLEKISRARRGNWRKNQAGANFGA
jgi:hypothetical protein